METIWNSEGYRKLRENMANGDLAAAACANCFAIKQGQALKLQFDPDAELERPPRTAYAKNMEKLTSEIAAGATRLEARPTVISPTPSHFCNFRCTQ